MSAAQHQAAAPPQKDESRELAGGAGLGGQAQTVSPDSAARAAVEQADKDFATLRARLALAGHQLHIIDDGEGGTAYMVCRWCMSRTLPDLAAVQAFAERVGAPA